MPVHARVGGRSFTLYGRRDLRRVLDIVTRANRRWLRAHPRTPSLYSSGVVYQKEPRGQENWRMIPDVLRIGHGDCEDLATWRAAEIPGARAEPIRTRAGWHIIVVLPSGRTEDPSKRLGMGRERRPRDTMAPRDFFKMVRRMEQERQYVPGPRDIASRRAPTPQRGRTSPQDFFRQARERHERSTREDRLGRTTMAVGFRKTRDGVYCTGTATCDGHEITTESFEPWPLRNGQPVGGIFSDIYNTVRGVAENKVFKTIANTALGIAKTVIPGGAAAAAAIDMAQTAIGAATGGGRGGAAAPTPAPAAPTPAPAAPRRQWLVTPPPGGYGRGYTAERARGMQARIDARRGPSRLPTADQIRSLRYLLRYLSRYERERYVRRLLGVPRG